MYLWKLGLRISWENPGRVWTGYPFPGVLNLGSHLPFFLCAPLACEDGLSCEGPRSTWARCCVGCPYLHFSSVLLCGCAEKHLTGRTGKGATARFLSYCLSLLWIRENLLATEAFYTNEQAIFVLMLLVFEITISEMEIRYAQCLEKCVLVKSCHIL